MHTEEACKHAPIYLATMYVCIAHSSYFKEAIVIHDKISRGAPILFSDFVFFVWFNVRIYAWFCM